MSCRCKEKQKKDVIPFSSVVEAHCCFVDKGELILSMYICSRINNIFIAGCFCLVGRPLTTVYKTVMQLTKAYEAETFCNETVIDSADIDSATYMLRINSS